MTIQAGGTITFTDIANEYSIATSNIRISDLRDQAGLSAGVVNISDFYGLSAGTSPSTFVVSVTLQNETEAKVSWNHPSNINTGDTYDVYRKLETVANSKNVTTTNFDEKGTVNYPNTSHVFASLTPNTYHSFLVVAKNSFGTTESNKESLLISATAPQFTLTSTRDNTVDLDVSWTITNAKTPYNATVIMKSHGTSSSVAPDTTLTTSSAGISYPFGATITNETLTTKNLTATNKLAEANYYTVAVILDYYGETTTKYSAIQAASTSTGGGGSTGGDGGTTGALGSIALSSYSMTISTGNYATVISAKYTYTPPSGETITPDQIEFFVNGASIGSFNYTSGGFVSTQSASQIPSATTTTLQVKAKKTNYADIASATYTVPIFWPVTPSVTATNITTNSVDLSWESVEGATSYYVWNDVGNTTIDVGNETSYTLTGLSENTLYQIKVAARADSNALTYESDLISQTSAISITTESNVTVGSFSWNTPPEIISATNVTFNFNAALSADNYDAYWRVSSSDTWILFASDISHSTDHNYSFSAGTFETGSFDFKIVASATNSSITREVVGNGISMTPPVEKIAAFNITSLTAISGGENWTLNFNRTVAADKLEVIKQGDNSVLLTENNFNANSVSFSVNSDEYYKVYVKAYNSENAYTLNDYVDATNSYNIYPVHGAMSAPTVTGQYVHSSLSLYANVAYSNMPGDRTNTDYEYKVDSLGSWKNLNTTDTGIDVVVANSSNAQTQSYSFNMATTVSENEITSPSTTITVNRPHFVGRFVREAVGGSPVAFVILVINFDNTPISSSGNYEIYSNSGSLIGTALLTDDSDDFWLKERDNRSTYTTFKNLISPSVKYTFYKLS